MKYIIIAFFFLPIYCMGQSKKTKVDSIEYNLRRATESFGINRCPAMCAIKKGLMESNKYFKCARH